MRGTGDLAAASNSVPPPRDQADVCAIVYSSLIGRLVDSRWLAIDWFATSTSTAATGRGDRRPESRQPPLAVAPSAIAGPRPVRGFPAAPAPPLAAALGSPSSLSHHFLHRQCRRRCRTAEGVRPGHFAESLKSWQEMPSGKPPAAAGTYSFAANCIYDGGLGTGWAPFAYSRLPVVGRRADSLWARRPDRALSRAVLATLRASHSSQRLSQAVDHGRSPSRHRRPAQRRQEQPVQLARRQAARHRRRHARRHPRPRSRT